MSAVRFSRIVDEFASCANQLKCDWQGRPGNVAMVVCMRLILVGALQMIAICWTGQMQFR